MMTATKILLYRGVGSGLLRACLHNEQIGNRTVNLFKATSHGLMRKLYERK